MNSISDPVFVSAITAPTLVDASIKGSFLLATIGLATLLLRQSSAATRHFAWLLGLAALLVIPVLTVSLPGWRVLPAWASLPQSGNLSPSPSIESTPIFQDHLPSPSPIVAPLEVPSVPTPPVDMDQPASSAPTPALAEDQQLPTRDWLMVAWLCVSATLLCRLAIGACLLGRATAKAAEVTGGHLHEALRQVCRQLKIHREVRLYQCAGNRSPMVWGIFRPCLLLPADADLWDASRLRAVLLHELAHIKRGDLLAMLLTQICCAIHWFNPLVWLAAWRLAVERERACDDCALTAGIRASDYAEHLLHVATVFPDGEPSGALAMARPSRLEGRLLSVLKPDENRRALPRWIAWTWVALAIAATIPVAMLQAQDAEASHPQSGPQPLGPSAQPEREPLEVDTTPQSTKKSGQWRLRSDVILTVSQEIYHGADVLSSGVLQWSGRAGRPAMRHEFGLAADAFGNREPWMMAWDPNEPALWIAAGKTHFLADQKPAKHRLSRLRKLDFSDPARIVETHLIPAGHLPEFARTAFAGEFDYPASDEAKETQTYVRPALLEHSWVVSGITKTSAGKAVGNVPIALSFDDEAQPFEQTRSQADGRFLSSFRPPISALERGCNIRIRGNRINGAEPPPDFQEESIELTADMIRGGLAQSSPGSSASTLSGTVAISSGESLAGALIAAFSDNQPISGVTTRADEQGRFVLRGVPANQNVSLAVEATRWKRRAQVGGVRLSPGEHTDARLVIAPGDGWNWKLSYHLTKDANGNPPRGGAERSALENPTAFAPTPVQSQAVTPVQESPNAEVLEVKRDGSFSLNSKAVTLDELAAALKAIAKSNAQSSVAIRAGKDVSFRDVTRALEATTAAGLRSVAFGTAGDKAADNERQDSTDHARKVAAIRLRYAERELERLTAMEKQSAVSSEQIERARTEVQVLRAEIAGDATRVLAVRLDAAERALRRIQELGRQNLVSAEEIDRATMEVELHRAELSAHRRAPADRPGAEKKSHRKSQYFTGITRPAGRLPVHGLDGVIAEVLVAAGSKVKAGDPLARVGAESLLATFDGTVTTIQKQKGDTIRSPDAVMEIEPEAATVAHFYVPPSVAKGASVGGAARVQTDGGSEMNGRIATVAETDPASGLVRISILLASPDGRPGAEQKAIWVFAD